MVEAPSSTESAGLEVPGEPGVYWCARHKKVKTRLRCGRCEKPVCPRCTVMGPTGARCPDCASNRTSHIYQVSPLQYLATFLAASVLSAGASLLVRLVGLLVLFYAPLVGTLLGKVITRVTRGKRGIKLALVASAGAILGALAPLAVMWLMLSPVATQPGAPAALLGLSLLPEAGYTLLYLALSIPAIWWWIK